MRAPHQLQTDPSSASLTSRYWPFPKILFASCSHEPFCCLHPLLSWTGLPICPFFERGLVKVSLVSSPHLGMLYFGEAVLQNFCLFQLLGSYHPKTWVPTFSNWFCSMYFSCCQLFDLCLWFSHCFFTAFPKSDFIAGFPMPDFIDFMAFLGPIRNNARTSRKSLNQLSDIRPY